MGITCEEADQNGVGVWPTWMWVDCILPYLIQDMEEQVHWSKGEDEVVQSNSPVNPSVQCRCVASNVEVIIL